MNNNYYLKKLNSKSLQEIFGYKSNDNFSVEKNLNKEILINLGLVDGIIYNYDSVVSDNISRLDIDYQNIIEARFFNENMEIRVFRKEEEFIGTIFNENKNCNSIKTKFILCPRYRKKEKYAKELMVKKYINYDEDCQAYINYVKPSKLNFGEEEIR